jgi:hypothetical protein
MQVLMECCYHIDHKWKVNNGKLRATSIKEFSASSLLLVYIWMIFTQRSKSDY